MELYLRHTVMTDPGRYATAIKELPTDPSAISTAVQNLLIHTEYLDDYDLDAGHFDSMSRETLGVGERLNKATRQNPLIIIVGQPPEQRSPGTCRDFALMATSFLREHGMAARVRCGFADYFFEGRFEDHWISEYQLPGSSVWRIIDAQIDDVHKRNLKIEFDEFNVPRASFMMAAEAWDCVSRQVRPASHFGHEDARGIWFMIVNLARDLHALSGHETSAWDGWRAYQGDGAKNWQQVGDALCRKINQCSANNSAMTQVELDQMVPFW